MFPFQLSVCQILRCLFFPAMTLGIAVSATAETTWYVRPDGNDENSGLEDTTQGAWRSIDRGQPTRVREVVRPGDTVIKVERAVQFPLSGRIRVGGKEIRYRSRTADELLGCDPLEEIPVGYVVESLDYPPPAPGDTVWVASGVYFRNMTGKAPESQAVAWITKSGRKGKPIRFIGVDRPVIDGRNETLGLGVFASGIEVKGFAVRRGGMHVHRGRDIWIEECHFSEGNRGLTVANSNDVTIRQNLLWDFVGAWTNHGLNLDQSNNVTVEHNTFVSSGWGIRIAGGRQLTIRYNLISACGVGIRLQGAPPKNLTISDNNLWRCGRFLWLAEGVRGNESRYYEGLNFQPSDLHEDPRIVSWAADTDEFLAPHFNSPCVQNGKTIIGAVGPREYPPLEKASGNLVPQSRFSAGLFGWTFPMSVKVVPSGRNAGENCLESLRTDIDALIRSQNFPLQRGRPVVIRFDARSLGERFVLDAGLSFPSWQDRSVLAGKVPLTAEWQEHTFRLEVPDYYPNIATFFLNPRRGSFQITNIRVTQEEESSAELFEVVPKVVPAMLFPSGQPVPAEIHSLANAKKGNLEWTLEAPFLGQVGKGTLDFMTEGENRKADFAIPMKTETGFYFVSCKVRDSEGRIVGRGSWRFAVGLPPADARNSLFFAATPGYIFLVPGTILDMQMQALAAMGMRTLHLYAGMDRMFELLSLPSFLKVLEASSTHGIEWLLTLSDSRLLTGEATWAPGPGEDNSRLEKKIRDDLQGRLTNEQMGAWKNTIRALAERYRGKIRFWEVLNEPNTFLSGKEYAKVLEETSEALRETDPAAVIIGGSVVNALRKELYEETLKSDPGTYNHFSYHPYRFGLPNPEAESEGYRVDLLNTKDDLKKNGHSPRIFLTEEGMGNGWDETRCINSLLSYSNIIRFPRWTEGEIRQAQYYARMLATALGEDATGYCYHTLSGLVNDSLMTPNLALQAAHTMSVLLGDAVTLGALDLGDDYCGYLFRSHPGTDVPLIAVIWPKDAEYLLPMSLRVSGLPIAGAANLFGNQLSRDSENSENLVFGKELIYLKFDSSDATMIRKKLTESFSGRTARLQR